MFFIDFLLSFFAGMFLLHYASTSGLFSTISLINTLIVLQIMEDNRAPHQQKCRVKIDPFILLCVDTVAISRLIVLTHVAGHHRGRMSKT